MSGINISFDPKLFDKIKQNLDKEKNAIVGEITALAQKNVRVEIDQKRLRDTGNFWKSVQIDFRPGDKNAVGIVGTNSLYALPLELGIMKKFFPSRDMVLSIAAWAKRKGIRFANKTTGKPMTFERTGSIIAWSIARHAADRGFPRRFGPGGARVFEAGFKKTTASLPKIIERFIRRAAAGAQPEVK